jgi:effector-binding domain-containing protein
MLTTPHIVKTDAQLAAVIPFAIPRSEIRMVMAPGIAELLETLAHQGAQPAGPLFAHHFRLDPEFFDFELGFPVKMPVTPEGRVRPGQLPAATVARAIYQGPYEGLPAAWAALKAWIVTEKLEPGADLWESYLTAPDVATDPADYRTELNWPLKF